MRALLNLVISGSIIGVMIGLCGIIAHGLLTQHDYAAASVMMFAAGVILLWVGKESLDDYRVERERESWRK